jgi:hypothetical protein
MSAMASSPGMSATGPVVGRGARLAWTLAGLVLAVTAVTVWVSQEVSIEFRNSYAAIPPAERTYPDPVRRLVVDVGSGTVTIERGSGTTTVVDTAGTRSLRTPTDDEHLIGSTLYLRSSCGSSFGFSGYCGRDYHVRVPADVTVTASVATGSILVAGMHGAVKASVETGNVSVIGDVGSLDVSTQSGSIVVRREDGSLDASAGTGDVLLADSRGAVTVQSANGNVVISGASTSVHVTAQTGSLDATGLAGSTFSATVANGNIDLSFTAAPHEVDASTQTGSVTVHVPFNDVRYQLHLKSATGKVITGIPNDPSSTRIIRVITANGDIILGVGVVPTTASPTTPPSAPSTPAGP